MWYKNVGTNFFHFVTIHEFDRQTDRQTEMQYRALHYMQSCSNNHEDYKDSNSDCENH